MYSTPYIYMQHVSTNHIAPYSNLDLGIYDVFFGLNSLNILTYGRSPSSISYQGKPMKTIVYKESFEMHRVCCKRISEVTLQIGDQTITVSPRVYPCLRGRFVMSTLVKNEDDYLPQWIEYHRNLGVDHFIIYDNKQSPVSNTNLLTQDDIRVNPDTTNLSSVLSQYIQSGLVTLIEWPYKYFDIPTKCKAQLLQEHHSLYAFRDTRYMGFFDVDEYVNPQGFSTIESCLQSYIHKHNIDEYNLGGFILRNKWFHNPSREDPTGYKFLYMHVCDHITIGSRSKCFVIPSNVDAFDVHVTIASKPTVELTEEHMFFNHYGFLNKKDRNISQTGLRDDTILRHIKFLSTPTRLIANIIAGLGNQLFQVASIYSVAKAQGKPFFINTLSRSPHSRIDYTENLFRVFNVDNRSDYNVYKEPSEKFTDCIEIPTFTEDTLVCGFFQNEKYFLHVRHDLLRLFEIEPARNEYLCAHYPDTHIGVFVHFRRTDYVNNPNYDIVDNEYYRRAIAYFQKKNPDALYYICSDDIAYCKELPYLKSLDRIVYVQEDEVNTLYLMARCALGGIGTNSTFSWWGGWLNQFDTKVVIYPDRWYGDRTDLDIWWKGSYVFTNNSNDLRCL